MGEPVNQAQFFEEMRRLDARLQEGFEALRDELREHAKEDQAIAQRVLTIEIQRQDEARAAMRRGTWAGIWTGLGFNALIVIAKAWFGKQ